MPHTPQHLTDEDFQRQIESRFTKVRDLAQMRQKLLNMAPEGGEESLAISDALASLTRAVIVAEAKALRRPPPASVSREVVDQANDILTTGARMRALMAQYLVEESQAGRRSGWKHEAARAINVLIGTLEDYEGNQPVDSQRDASRVLAIIQPFGREPRTPNN